MEFPPVLTKVDFSRRYAAGEFGNASPTWHDLDAFVVSEYSGLVHLRNRVAGGATYYNQTPGEAENLWRSQNDRTMWYCSAMAPSKKTTFQGEVIQLPSGLELTYTTVAKPMRDALRERTQYASRLVARLLLEHYMDPVDYDWLQVLLERYDGHVVEFSCYSVSFGTLGRRTVIWECRMY